MSGADSGEGREVVGRGGHGVRFGTGTGASIEKAPLVELEITYGDPVLNPPGGPTQSVTLKIDEPQVINLADSERGYPIQATVTARKFIKQQADPVTTGPPWKFDIIWSDSNSIHDQTAIRHTSVVKAMDRANALRLFKQQVTIEHRLCLHFVGKQGQTATE